MSKKRSYCATIEDATETVAARGFASAFKKASRLSTVKRHGEVLAVRSIVPVGRLSS